MWAEDQAYEALGTRLRIRIENSAYAAAMVPPLAVFARARAATRARDTYQVAWDQDLGATVLYHDGSVVASGSPAELTNRWLQEANQRFVLDAPMFAAHAGVVGSDTAVAAIIAESGAGKTTLTGAVALAGLRYGSDESLCLTDDGEAVPYPKPLGMSPWTRTVLGLSCPKGFETLEEAPITPEAIGVRLLEEGRRLTHVILPEVEMGAIPDLTPITPSEVMGALIANSFNHYRNPAGTFVLTAEMARTVRGYRFRYSDPRAAAEVLVRMLA